MRKSNPLYDLDVSQIIMIGLVLFVVILFVLDVSTNGALSSGNVTDILKAISGIFGGKGE